MASDGLNLQQSTTAEPTPGSEVDKLVVSMSERHDVASSATADLTNSRGNRLVPGRPGARNSEESAEAKQLVKRIEKLQNQIEKLSEEECDLDALESDESVYLLEDRLKRELVAAWHKYCKIVGQTARISPERPRKFNLEMSVQLHHKKINQRLQKYAAGIEFPVREEMLHLMRKCMRHYELSWSEDRQKQYVDAAFQILGKQAQRDRQKRFWTDHGSRLTDRVVEHVKKKRENPSECGPSDVMLDDPALHDRELEAKLKRNHQQGQQTLTALINEFGNAAGQGSDDAEPSGASSDDGEETDDDCVDADGENSHIEHGASENDDETDDSGSADDDTSVGTGARAADLADDGVSTSTVQSGVHGNGRVASSSHGVDELGTAGDNGVGNGGGGQVEFAAAVENDYDLLYGDTSTAEEDDVPLVFDEYEDASGGKSRHSQISIPDSEDELKKDVAADRRLRCEPPPSAAVAGTVSHGKRKHDGSDTREDGLDTKRGVLAAVSTASSVQGGVPVSSVFTSHLSATPIPSVLSRHQHCGSPSPQAVGRQPTSPGSRTLLETQLPCARPQQASPSRPSCAKPAIVLPANPASASSGGQVTLAPPAVLTKAQLSCATSTPSVSNGSATKHGTKDKVVDCIVIDD